MKQITKILVGLALGCGMASNVVHASAIQSMTIEEIGIASGGLGTSSSRLGGGGFSFNNSPSFFVGFTSMGSDDGAILMGIPQRDAAFTPGFLFAGTTVYPNTMAGAPSGVINGSNLLLNLSGWGVNVYQGLGYFPLPPDIGTLITSASSMDRSHYFYTADWHHQITADDDPSGTFTGFTTFWHLEGIATVPEPGTLWLLGASTLGLMVSRRRRRA